MVDSAVEILRSRTFDRWLGRLKDERAVGRILARIDRLALGNSGDVKSVGGGVSELRIDYGPGYRVHVAQRGRTIILLLCGGDKSTQSNDISVAQGIATEWRNDD